MPTESNFCCGDGHPDMVEVEAAWDFGRLGVISGFLCWQCPACTKQYINGIQDKLLQQRIQERKAELNNEI